MSLAEIEKNIIEPLSLNEKQDLHAYLSRELKRAEFAKRLKNVKELHISPGFETDPEVAENLLKAKAAREKA